VRESSYNNNGLKNEKKDLKLKNIENQVLDIIRNTEIPDIEKIKLNKTIKKRIENADQSELEQIEKELGIDINDTLLKIEKEEDSNSEEVKKYFSYEEDNEVSKDSSIESDTDEKVTEQSIDGRCEVIVAENLMSASINLYPSRGNGNPLTFDMCKKLIDSKGIVYGVNCDLIKKLVDNIEKKKIEKTGVIFAKGTANEDGKDGEVEFCFSKGEDVLFKEETDNDDSVIY